MASQVVEDTSLAMQPLEEQEEESHTSVSALLKQVIVEEDSIQIEKYRERLRNFFWAHDPRRVEKVDEILQRQKVYLDCILSLYKITSYLTYHLIIGSRRRFPSTCTYAIWRT
jgi:hypothetical protein